MSKEALAKVVQRAISDASFRRQLSSDTAGALRGFDLTPDEVSALRAGDAGRLSTLGVDQRMSKSFALGGMAAATRMAQSDLTAGSAAAFDDGAAGSRTVIPADPESAANADADGGAGVRSTVRAGDDYKFAGRQAPEATGATSSVAPVEGSPEATAAEIGGAGGRSASAINDDPDGFLAANADATGGAAARASAINDDPDGFLAANKNADLSGGTSVEGTAYLDDSEAYLSKIGYDANAATSAVSDAHDRGDSGVSAVTDAHDRGEVTRADDDADGTGTSANSEQGPNISS